MAPDIYNMCQHYHYVVVTPFLNYFLQTQLFSLKYRKSAGAATSALILVIYFLHKTSANNEKLWDGKYFPELRKCCFFF